MLQSDRISLRAPEPEDLETLYRWENDTTLWQHGNTLNLLSRFALKEFIATCSESIFDTKQTRLMITRTRDGLLLGAVDLFNLDVFHQRAGIGIMIDAEFLRQGIAREAINMVTAYCFKWLHLHQIFAHVSQSNTASIGLFRACGFEETGILKDWIKESEAYQNVVVLQLLSPVKEI